MADTTKGGKKNRKLGRQAHHPAHIHYNSSRTREKNKAKRVLRSNGTEAFEAYCSSNNLSTQSLRDQWAAKAR